MIPACFQIKPSNISETKRRTHAEILLINQILAEAETQKALSDAEGQGSAGVSSTFYGFLPRFSAAASLQEL